MTGPEPGGLGPQEGEGPSPPEKDDMQGSNGAVALEEPQDRMNNGFAQSVGSPFEVSIEDRTFRVVGGRIDGQPGPELVKALCEARQNIELVEKNGYNDYLRHEYATYDDVMRAVAVPLAEAGVCCFESVVDTFKQYAGKSPKGADQYLVTVVLETLWTDGISSFRSYWIGETLDSGDKHHYQLLSQVTKYAYAKTLKLDTGDPDVDAEHVETTQEGEAPAPMRSEATGEPASERQVSYIKQLQERCRARGGSDEEHELLGVVAKSKAAASQQIEGLKQLEKELVGAGADE